MVEVMNISRFIDGGLVKFDPLAIIWTSDHYKTNLDANNNIDKVIGEVLLLAAMALEAKDAT
jgi:hypothetical protein